VDDDPERAVGSAGDKPVAYRAEADVAADPTTGDAGQARGWMLELVILLTALGLLLRLRSYTLAPAPTDNTDELAWAWSGLTLITKHVPYAWSDFWSTYGSWQGLRFHGTGYTIVHPWLDHPPAFSLLIGGTAWLSGARDLSDVTLDSIRLPAVLLSTSTIPLAYLLGRRLSGVMPALAAAVLLAVAPGEVLLSHVVESEALLAPLFLLAVLLLHRLVHGEGGRGTVAGILVCCALAPLVKIPGIAVCVTVAAILVSRGRWRLGIGAVGAGLLGLLVFTGYGAFLDWHLFVAVQQYQGSRHHGLTSVFTYIGGAVGINYPLHDGWWLLGWIALAAVILRSRDDVAVFLGWPVLTYALAMMVMADPHLVEMYGWYRITLYPFIYLLAGILVWRSIESASVPGVALTIAVAGGVATNGLGADHGAWSPPAFVVAALLLVILVPCVLAAWKPQGRMLLVGQIAAAAGIVAVVGANLAQTIMLSDLFRSL
jgi:4-amino-4-deoxy-L-arabinose transferase-like glycosyltransferase